MNQNETETVDVDTFHVCGRNVSLRTLRVLCRTASGGMQFLKVSSKAYIEKLIPVAFL
jgi:hypothetical protein